VIIPTINAEFNRDLSWQDSEIRQDESGHEHPLRMETVTVTLDKTASFQSLQMFFEKLASGAFGNVSRAKALLRTDRGPYRFDLASKQVRTELFSKEVENSRLVIIGKDLDEEKIREIVM